MIIGLIILISMKNIPKKIYLVIGDEDPKPKDFNELDHEHICWAQSRTDKSDLEYILNKNDTNKDKWISVNERFPDINCDVLVAKRNGRILQMSYHSPFDSGKRIFHWWGFGRWMDQHSQVTHWQLLPSAPKQ